MKDAENDFSATQPAAWLLTEPPGDLCQAPAVAARGSPPAPCPSLRAVPHGPLRRRRPAATWGGTAAGVLGLLRQWAGGAAR